MIIKKVENEKEANVCDLFLSKLIRSEKEFNDNIKIDFTVCDYFKNLYDKKNNAIFIAIEEDKIVGYIYVKMITSEKSPEVNHEAMIDGLFVEESYRKQGIATMLMKEAQIWSFKAGAKYISLNVLYQNENAKQLYYREGFQDFSVTLKKEL